MEKFGTRVARIERIEFHGNFILVIPRKTKWYAIIATIRPV